MMNFFVGNGKTPGIISACCKTAGYLGSVILAFGLGVTSLPAAAQDSLGFKLAPGTRVYPELQVRGAYDSNLYYTRNDEESEFITLINPAIGIISEGNRLQLEGGARAEVGEYDEQVESDYTDGVIFGSADYLLTSKNRFSLRAESNFGHDPFGLRQTQSGVNQVDRDVDEYIRQLYRGRYTFGAEGARFNVSYEPLYINKRYTSNRNLGNGPGGTGPGNRFLDYDRLEHIGSLVYNYSPKTALLLQGRLINLDYDREPSGAVPRGFNEGRILVGTSWRAAAKTTGRLLVGFVNHDSDDSRRDDFSRFDWEAQVDWTPLAKTTFSINTGRRTDDSFLLTSAYINSRIAGASWSQRWTSRFSSRLLYNNTDAEFEGFSRSDKFNQVNLEGTYLLTRSIALVSTFTYFDRDSTFDQLNFSKEIVSFGISYRP